MSFYSEDDDFFPERFTITTKNSHHTTLDDDAKQHNDEEETTTNKKKERRRRRGSNSRTRWVFSNSYVSLLFTMLVLCIGYLNAEIEIRSVDSWFIVDRIAAERLNHSATSALVYITR